MRVCACVYVRACMCLYVRMPVRVRMCALVCSCVRVCIYIEHVVWRKYGRLSVPVQIYVTIRLRYVSLKVDTRLGDVRV